MQTVIRAAVSSFITAGIVIMMAACSGKWPYAPEQFTTPTRKASLADLISADTLRQFMSFTKAKIAFMEGAGKSRKIVFADYSQSGAEISLQSLHMPIEQDASLAYPSEAPIISPDGEWVTYFLTDKATTNIAYVQKLDTSSLPVKLADDAAHPHWWQSPGGKLYIVYCSDASGDIEKDTGYTKLQEVNASNPTSPVGAASTIANDSFNGGMSADSQYLCTGDYRSYYYDLANSTAISINPGTQTCNASISPDTGSLGHRMMFLNIGGSQTLANDAGSYSQHEIVYIVGTNNTAQFSFNKNDVFSDERGEWQDPEWSNHPDYFIALSRNPARGSDQALQPFDCFIVKIQDNPELIQINNEKLFGLRHDASPYLWIEK